MQARFSQFLTFKIITKLRPNYDCLIKFFIHIGFLISPYLLFFLIGASFYT